LEDTDLLLNEDPINARTEKIHKIIYHVCKPENRLTSHVISKFERSNACSIRTDHIEKYGQAMVNFGNEVSASDIANKEFNMNKNPLMIMREYKKRVIDTKNNVIHAYVELWKVSEM